MGDKKLDITAKVIEECKKNVEDYLSIADLTERAKKVTHHQVCVDLFRKSRDTQFPISVLIYIAVGTQCHKTEFFDKGFTKFDADRADKIVKWANEVVKKFKLKESSATNANLIHALSRFEKLGGTHKFLKKRLGEVTDFDLKVLKNAKEVGKALFGDALTYNEHGYIVIEK